MATLRHNSGDSRRPVVGRTAGDDGERSGRAPARAEAPLIDLLGEIRTLHTLRLDGRISDAEYERRRSQVLRRI
jgi:hypothetical protein